MITTHHFQILRSLLNTYITLKLQILITRLKLGRLSRLIGILLTQIKPVISIILTTLHLLLIQLRLNLRIQKSIILNLSLIVLIEIRLVIVICLCILIQRGTVSVGSPVMCACLLLFKLYSLIIRTLTVLSLLEHSIWLHIWILHLIWILFHWWSPTLGHWVIILVLYLILSLEQFVIAFYLVLIGNNVLSWTMWLVLALTSSHHVHSEMGILVRTTTRFMMLNIALLSHFIMGLKLYL